MKEFFYRLKWVKLVGWRGAFDKNFIKFGKGA